MITTNRPADRRLRAEPDGRDVALHRKETVMQRGRSLLIAWSFAALVFGVLGWQPGLAAQEPAPAPAVGQPAANAPNGPAGANKEPAKPKSRFLWVIYSSGFIGAFILVLSIYFVA